MIRIVGLLLIVFLGSSCTSPQSMKMTAHASFGCSKTDYKGNEYVGPTNDSCGSSKIIGRVGGGFLEPILNTPVKGEPIESDGRPTNMLEAEVGYVRHGDMQFDGLWLGTPDSGTIEAKGYILGVVYTRRINDQFDLFANAGAHRWDVEENETYDGVPYKSEASGTSPYYGLGGRYWVHPKAAVRAAWERYTNVGEDGVTGKGDIDNLWLGVDYVF